VLFFVYGLAEDLTFPFPPARSPNAGLFVESPRPVHLYAGCRDATVLVFRAWPCEEVACPPGRPVFSPGLRRARLFFPQPDTLHTSVASRKRLRSLLL